MDVNIPTMAQELAHLASDFQQQRTGHAPKAVTVVLGEDTLVFTLHEALSPIEKILAKSPDGAAHLQDYHRQLFRNSADLLGIEIKRITGREVLEAAAEVDPNTGSVVHAFTGGTMVQVFLLAENASAEMCLDGSRSRFNYGGVCYVRRFDEGSSAS
jgi:uncharacterized protein YbcI